MGMFSWLPTVHIQKLEANSYAVRVCARPVSLEMMLPVLFSVSYLIPSHFFYHPVMDW